MHRSINYVGLLGLFLLAACSSSREESEPIASSSNDPLVGVADAKLRAVARADGGQLKQLSRHFSIGFDERGEARFHVRVQATLGTQLPQTADVRPGVSFGQIRTADVTRAGLETLARTPGVKRIELATRMHPTNDVGTALSGGIRDSLAAGQTKSYPYTPAATGEKLTVKMNKGTMSPFDPPPITPLDFDSVLKICRNQDCSGGAGNVLATDDDSGPDHDAVVSYTFTNTTPVYINAAEKAGKAGPFTLTVIGDGAKQDYVLGTGARHLQSQESRNGTGVIVAVIDTGIDFCNPDFYNDATKQTRILALWDHSLTPQAGESSPTGYTFGVEYTRAQINSALAATCDGTSAVRMRDEDAHGTHVTGTAAGDGTNVVNAADSGKYMGAAPAADIIMVKGLGTGITDQHLEDALHYVVTRAQQANEPVVINMSFGGMGDSNDGLSLFDEAMSAGAGAGRAVIVSNGNDGDVALHAKGTVSGCGVDTIKFTIPACAPGACEQNILSIWFAGGDSYDFIVSNAAGSSFKLAYTEADGQLHSGQVGGVGVQMIADPSPEPNGDKNAYVLIDPLDSVFGDAGTDAGSVAAQQWSLTLVRRDTAGNGTWDAYSAAATPALFDDHVTPLKGQDGFTYYLGTVGSPATGLGVIAVGAAGTMYRWASSDGTATPPNVAAIRSAYADFGDLAYFSSRGPTRDGRTKPDIASPGFMTVSSLSQFASPAEVGPRDKLLDGKHAVFAGTSMASPNVTGAVALLLQEYPTLYARPLLRRSAATDKATGATFDANLWGKGKMDVVRALALLRADTRAPTVSALVAAPTSPAQGQSVTLTATATDADTGDSISEYLWDFDGDGFTDDFTTTNSTTTVYDTAGMFTARVTVADQFGKTATRTRNITVRAADGGTPPPPPPNDAGTPPDAGVCADPIVDASPDRPGDVVAPPPPTDGPPDGPSVRDAVADTAVADRGSDIDARPPGTDASSRDASGPTDGGSDDGATSTDSGVKADAASDSGGKGGSGGSGGTGMPPSDDSGCGCRVAQRPAGTPGGVLMIAAASALFGIRRRSRAGRVKRG